MGNNSKTVGLKADFRRSSRRSSEKIYRALDLLRNPSLIKLKYEGGLPSTYNKLNTEWFKSLQIDTVLDIGANTGQFAKTIRHLLPDAQIIAFEPLLDCFSQLKKLSNQHSNIKALNLGIGDCSGELNFERSESSASSSFLKMTDVHKNSFPHTAKSTETTVKIERLDTAVQDLELGESIFIKIDVQGYEDKVIAGGTYTLKKAKLVVVETSYLHLYESQPLFEDIYKLFRSLGFSYAGVLEQLKDPLTGEYLQGDALFVNMNTLK